MMCYYLLRNNKESGPFTLKELTETPLLTTDLIWINGESTCWKSPDEIPELHGLAKAAPKELQAAKPRVKSTTAAAIPASFTATTNFPAVPPSLPAAGEKKELIAEEPLSRPSFEELKKKYAARAPRKKVWKSGINIGANLIGIATLVIGVSTAAFMIKKAVDNIEPDPIVATANAVEIGSADMHMSTTSQAALAPLTAAVALSQTATTEGTQPANVTYNETKGEELTRPAPPVVIKPEEKKDVSEKESEPKPALEKEQAELAPALEVIPVTEKKEQPEEAADKKKKTPALQLSANEYKVGLLGGISNLELSVTNPGSQAISKAVVEIEYLKPNGKVVGTQTVTVPGIAANASKKIAVPDNGRGTSVRYRIAGVEE